MAAATYSPIHPIVFVFDYSNEEMEVPEYDPEAVVSSNGTCVSIRTIADVDGDVLIDLVATFPTDVDPGVEVFRGHINVPSRKVAVVTSQNEKLLEMNVKNSSTEICIFVDEVENPSRLWVIAK